jgi:hypothetical protein
VTIKFLVTSLTTALLPQLLSLAGWPALGRVLGGSKLLSFKNGDFSWGAAILSELYGQFLRPHGLVFALTYCQLGPYRQVCLSKSCPINWIYHMWASSCRNTSKIRMHQLSLIVKGMKLFT